MALGVSPALLGRPGLKAPSGRKREEDGQGLDVWVGELTVGRSDVQRSRGGSEAELISRSLARSLGPPALLGIRILPGFVF